MSLKTCKACNMQKDLNLFSIKNKIKLYYYAYCKECKYSLDKEYRKKNKIKLTLCKKIWYLNNRDLIIKRCCSYKKNNRIKYNDNYKNRIKNDPKFKLRESIRQAIKYSLNKEKNGKSISDYLPYSIQELKEYLESKFDSWMNWTNHGKYNPLIWDESNSLTWTWQLDHIIPQSDLPYNSMTDENFKKCWALDNLRPYSAKQNLIDGSSRIRHKDK